MANRLTARPNSPASQHYCYPLLSSLRESINSLQLLPYFFTRYSARSAENKALHYAVFFSLLLLLLAHSKLLPQYDRQVSHPHKTTGKDAVRCTIFWLATARQEILDRGAAGRP